MCSPRLYILQNSKIEQLAVGGEEGGDIFIGVGMETMPGDKNGVPKAYGAPGVPKPMNGEAGRNDI